MKYLDFPQLTYLSTSLSNNPIFQPEPRVHVRFEAYSVKAVGKERKMFKEMEEAYMSEQEEMGEMSFSPEMKEAGLSSCFGRLDERESRKVHFLLVSTLNAAFPDHDFSSLRPDHFTRETSATQVFSQLSRNIFGPTIMPPPPLPVSSFGASPSNVDHHLSSSHGHAHAPSSPFSGSPSSLPNITSPPDVFRALNEVVPMDECEVYSWFPEPEYDPHAQEDEEDDSDDGYGLMEDLDDLNRNDDIEVDVDADMDMEPSWGQAGMELDEVEQPASQPTVLGKTRSATAAKRKSEETPASNTGTSLTAPARQRNYSVMEDQEREIPRERPMGGLLWSSNYFFYSKSRPLGGSSPDDRTAIPLPLSSSYNGAAASNEFALASIRSARALKSQHKTSSRLVHKRSRQNLRPGDPSSTIPIRGLETPKHRLASSAPSSTFISHHHHHYHREPTPSPAGAIARMTAGGFKPRQTPTRNLINAAKAAKAVEERKAKEVSGSETVSILGDGNTALGLGGIMNRLVTPPNVVEDSSKGKRVKV